MRRTITLDMTPGYEQFEVLELTVRLRVPVTPSGAEADGHASGTLRVSIDHQLEQIRRQMRAGTAAKVDEDNLVVFRLLQALGFEYWPVEDQDL